MGPGSVVITRLGPININAVNLAQSGPKWVRLIGLLHLSMGQSLVITTRPGPIAINAEKNLITHIIIKRAGPNYYVRKRVIISSAFIAMGPILVITTRPRPMQKKLSVISSHNNRKGWSQLLCEETGDNFSCIYSNGPKPCNQYKAWAHYYKCRSPINNLTQSGPK